MAQNKRNKQGQFKTRNNGSSDSGISNILNEYGKSNVLKGIGIAAGIGALVYLAYKYVPFDKLFSNLEEAYDEHFGEDEKVKSKEYANVEE